VNKIVRYLVVKEKTRHFIDEIAWKENGLTLKLLRNMTMK